MFYYDNGKLRIVHKANAAEKFNPYNRKVRYIKVDNGTPQPIQPPLVSYKNIDYWEDEADIIEELEGLKIYYYATQKFMYVTGKVLDKYQDQNKQLFSDETPAPWNKSDTRYGEINILYADFDANGCRMTRFFGNCKFKEFYTGPNFNTTGVKYMDFLFQGYNLELENIYLVNIDTSSVIDMSYMFQDLQKIATLDLSAFDTTQVTNFAWMFGNARGLRELNISTFRTPNALNMQGMFRETLITELDLSNFDTRKVTNRSYFDKYGIFSDMKELQTITFGENCTFEKALHLEGMFLNCRSLTHLNLQSFDFIKDDNSRYVSKMFEGCSNLITLTGSEKFYLKSGTNVTDMFKDCTKLHMVSQLYGDADVVVDTPYTFHNLISEYKISDAVSVLSVPGEQEYIRVTDNHINASCTDPCDVCGYILPHNYQLHASEWTNTTRTNFNYETTDNIITITNSQPNTVAVSSSLTLTITCYEDMQTTLHYQTQNAVWTRTVSGSETTYGSDTSISLNDTILLNDSGSNKNNSINGDLILNLRTGVNTLIISYRTPSNGSVNNSLLTVTLDNLYKEYEVCGDCGGIHKASEFYQYSNPVLTLLDNNITYDDSSSQIRLSFNGSYDNTTQTIKLNK